MLNHPEPHLNQSLYKHYHIKMFNTEIEQQTRTVPYEQG